jgi:hypothetical protein
MVHSVSRAAAEKRSHLKAVENLLRTARDFADELARGPNLGATTAPLAELKRISEMDLFVAPMARRTAVSVWERSRRDIFLSSNSCPSSAAEILR